MNLSTFDPVSIIRSLKKGRKSKLIAGILRRFYRSRPPEGVKVVEEDWDYLIVLDACRYDVFKEVYQDLDWLQGDFSMRKSRGSMSIEWLNRNFTDYYGDTVYVSSNTFVSPVDVDTHYGRKEFDSSEHFYDMIPLYMEDEIKEGNTTPPEAVTERTIDVSDEHPNKRFIIHYMQPHEPYIGDNYYASEKLLRELRREGKGFDEIRKYYKANLVRALESIRELMESLDGKFVITSDHGELLGEYGMHTHPHSVYVPELVNVPWLEVTKGDRREITEGEARDQEGYDEEEVKAQLANLGYGE